MKVTLDIDKLLEEKEITKSEYNKLKKLSMKSTTALAYNVLIGFGVVAVAGGLLALLKSSMVTIVLGLIVLLGGLIMQRKLPEKWSVLSIICILIGAIMSAGGILYLTKGSVGGFVTVGVIYTVAAIYARSSLLAVLAVFAFSSCFGARTGYWHASYFLSIKESTITMVVFTAAALMLYQLSLKLKGEYERLATIAARTSVFVVNFAMWIGSLWDDKVQIGDLKFTVDENLIAFVWAAALITTCVWAWNKNRRALFNICSVFLGIHMYTQYFEYFGGKPLVIIIAGLAALGFALLLKYFNKKLRAGKSIT